MKTGQAIAVFYDPIHDGKTFAPFKPMDDSVGAGFPRLLSQAQRHAPSGPLWDAYRTNLAIDSAMLRTVVLPPGVPAAAVDALRARDSRGSTTIRNSPRRRRRRCSSCRIMSPAAISMRGCAARWW